MLVKCELCGSTVDAVTIEVVYDYDNDCSFFVCRRCFGE